MAEVYRIPLLPVESSNLAAIGYDDAKQVLAVEFKNGTVYHYAGVSDETAAAFITAESKGRFYTQSIKGHYAGRKMTGHCPNCGALGRVGELCQDCGTAEVTEDPLKERHTE